MARGIYPLLDVVVERADQPFVNAALQDTDRRVNEGKPVAPSFLLACVLWADVRDGWAQRLATSSIRSRLAGRDRRRVQLPYRRCLRPRQAGRRHARDLDDAAALRQAHGSTPFSLADQPRFRAAFDFMRLRADVGEIDVVLADWWQEFSQASDAVREDLVAQLREEQHKGQRRVVRGAASMDKPAHRLAAAPESPAGE
jgi:poly(A) polymerase